jgi:CRP/FNR family transcriptional regulator, cyclic AMP receptor protein
VRASSTSDSNAEAGPFGQLFAGQWLRDQDASFCQALVRTGRRVSCETGEHITFEGDEDWRFFGVIRGSVGSFGSHRHDTPILGTLLLPGQWFGLNAALAKRPRSLTFVIKEPSELLSFGQREAQLLHDAFPDLSARLSKLSTINFDYTENVVGELLVPKVERRIVAVMLRLCRCTTASPSFPLSQAELAEMANASRGSVNRLLSQLELLGLISAGYGRITVRDPAGLERWFEADAERPAQSSR